MSNKISRRDFLKLAGTAAGGAVLAACAAPTTQAPPPPTAAPATAKPATAAPATEAPTAVPTKPPVKGPVVLMGNTGELSQAQIDAFQNDNPGITVELIAFDLNRFYAMLAAGAQLDLYRTQAPVLAPLMARKLFYDLTPYFQASDLIKVDDLAPANKGYWAKSPTEFGEGNIYGMCKDFSPDCSVWVNDNLFDAAKVDKLDDTTPITFDKWHEIAKATAVFQGQRIQTWGFGYENGWTDRFWMVALAETDKALYKNSFSAVDFGDDTKALADYYYTVTKERLTASLVDASPKGWQGGDFTAGILSTMQYGYWYGGMAETDANRGAVRMLPAPTWTGKHIDPTVTATGWTMISKTQVPDAAWKFFEYYMAGQPSIDRAGSGWGVPALKSQWNLMPNNTPFQKQVQKVLQGELAVNEVKINYNPFIPEGAFVNAWNTHVQEALTGTITFDELCSRTEKDVNTLIQEGISRLSG